MFNRLSVVAFFTGLSHFLSFCTLSLISRFISAEDLGIIGIIESTFYICMSILSFGLQLGASRNIALNKEWEKEYAEAQSARFTLAIVTAIVGLCIFYCSQNSIYLVFLLSPILALNGDYALYGIGRPVSAAVVSFIRVLIPSLFLLAFALFQLNYIETAFLISMGIGFAVSGILAARVLKRRYLYGLSNSFLKKYWENRQIGIGTLSFTLTSTGFIFIANYFYSENAIGNVLLGVKLIILFKGVRRIIVQSFFKDLTDSKICLDVDKIGILSGLGFVLVIFCYPSIIGAALFNSNSNDITLILRIFAVAGLISSLSVSAGTKILLKREDKSYAIIYGISAFITVSSSAILSQSEISKFGIPIGICLGELALVFLMVKTLGGLEYFTDRIFFIFKVLYLAVFFVGIRMLLSESWLSLSVASISFLAISLILQRQLFFQHLLLSQKQQNA